MNNQMKWADRDVYATATIERPSQTNARSLGGAIFLVAIQDYRSADEQEHKSAERFLYPRTREWQEQYDWAVALTEGLNPAWLRDQLDRCRRKWDRQRARQIALETSRALKTRLKLDRRSRGNEEQPGERIRPDGLVVPTGHTRGSLPSLQPAGEACGARTGDVAQSL
jgi:hypothetical protein